MKLNRRIFFLPFLFVWILLSAQENEYGLWSEFTLHKKVQKWDFSSTVDLRTTDYISNINRWSIDLDAAYKIAKSLKIGAAYKFIDFHDFKYDDFQPRNRFSLYLQGKRKIDRFTFSLREKAELTYKDESDRIKSDGTINTYTINPDIYWRNKLKVSYDIFKSPLKPAFSVETFYQIYNPEGSKFDEIRYTLSMSYRLSKRNSLEIYGLMSNELNVSSPVTKYILGLGYTISF